MATSKTRKPVDQLTEADLDECPVWEFALDEEHRKNQDETTVRPFRYRGDLDPSEGMFIVRAGFVLADGTVMYGYLTPEVQGETGIETVQPVIVSPRGQVLFWCGMVTPPLAILYERLGKTSPSQVFPVHFKSEVPFRGGSKERCNSRLSGFEGLEDWCRSNFDVVVDDIVTLKMLC